MKKKINARLIVIAAEIIVVILLCFLHSIQAGHYVNFYPINGTFQNFNPVRRLLSGQVPYRDFTDYLGLGHLYLGSVFTFLFGGDYHGSLIAFSFLTIGGLSAIAFIIGKAIFNDGIKAISWLNLVLCMLLIQPLFFENTIVGNKEIYNALLSALNPGNSARFVRGLIVPISVCCIISVIKKVKSIEEKNKFGSIDIDILRSVLIGLVASFCFLWSNDYGISCWLCIMIMYTIYSICENKKIVLLIRNIAILLFSSLFGMLAFTELFTFGNVVDWVKNTFGIGGYQGWYYQSKSFYIYDVDFSYLMLIQAFMCLIYLFILCKKGFTLENVKRYGVLAFVNMVSFCAVNEYRLLSGGDSREVALAILFINIFYELINRCEFNVFRSQNLLVMVSLIVGSALVISNAKDEIVFSQFTPRYGEYVEEMGGYMTSLASDIEATKEFIGSNKIFSTYASAQEVMNSTFQPSGIDYNIHVLGDKQREYYMNSFRNDEFMYTVTIQKNYTDWQLWNERANWFFYRELYKYWHPVYENTYELIWKRNGNNVTNSIQGQCKVDVTSKSDSTIVLSISTDSNINGIADVYIDYDVKKNDKLKAMLLIRDVLQVINTGNTNTDKRYFESNYLRSEGKEFVPMNIVDGYGELTLTSRPDDTTFIELNEVYCNEILQISYDDMAISVTNLTDSNWNGGISTNDNQRLLFAASERNEKVFRNAKKIICGDNEYYIKNVESDSSWIHVYVDRDATECAYPSVLIVE